MVFAEEDCARVLDVDTLEEVDDLVADVCERDDDNGSPYCCGTSLSSPELSESDELPSLWTRLGGASIDSGLACERSGMWPALHGGVPAPRNPESAGEWWP